MQPTRSQFHGLPQRPSFLGASTRPAAAQAVTAALSSPYGQAQFAYPQASHYAQAYAQYYNSAGPSAVTAEGYTISSTYTPGSQYNAYVSRPNSGQRPQTHAYRDGRQGPAGWYQPGTCRCSKQGCSFTGSNNAVQTHMMDRHLIYPPGWEHRKQRNDWDADPSLKGCVRLFVHPLCTG